MVNQGPVTQSQVHDYCRGFHEIGVKCIDKGNITNKALTFKFIYALPPNLKIKAMRKAAKGAKFDPDNMRSFQEVYLSIAESCAILKDMDSLVDEQGMGGLPPGLDSLDTTFAITIHSTRTYQEAPAEQENAVLPFIRARTRDQSTRMTNRDIDEITEGLDKLHILQAVAERAFQKVTTANVNAIGYDSLIEEYELTYDVSYREYQGRARQSF